MIRKKQKEDVIAKVKSEGRLNQCIKKANNSLISTLRRILNLSHQMATIKMEYKLPLVKS